MGCFSVGLSILYFSILLLITGFSRSGGDALVILCFGGGFWFFIWWAWTKVFPPEKFSGIPGEKLASLHPTEVRNLFRLRERVARARQLGAIGPTQVQQALMAVVAREERLWKRSLQSGPRSLQEALFRERGDVIWLREQVSGGRLAENLVAVLVSVDLTGTFPEGEPDLVFLDAEAAEALDQVADLDSEEESDSIQALSESKANSEDEESSEEAVSEQETALEADREEASLEEVAQEQTDSPGQEVPLAPGIVAWVPGVATSSASVLHILDDGEEDPTYVEGEPSPPTPGVMDRLLAKFMEEGQVRWAEAFFALFTLLAFLTGVVSVGYYWGALNPHLRFSFLVAGAALSAFLAHKVHDMDGLEETGRTLGVIAHLLAPVSLGALPFLVTAKASNFSFSLSLLVAALLLGVVLGPISAFTLGAHSLRLPRLYLAACVFATLLPKLLVVSPLRGLVLVGAGLAWLGHEGAQTGPGEELPGGRLLRLSMPVYLMLVALGAAHPIAALAPGAWAFGASMVGYLLWNAALAEGAGGDSFPGLPLGLQAAGFSLMGLAILGSFLLEPAFWGNLWLLASLSPAFLAATVSACVVGGARAAYTSASLLTVMAVLGAGPELGAYSTLILLPVAGCALGSAFLEARGPTAARAYRRAGGALLCYTLAVGTQAPLEGLTTSVALLFGTLPMVLVLRSRRAAFLSAVSVAGMLLFGFSLAWVGPVRVGLPLLGPWAGALAAAPWLALVGALAALVEAIFGESVAAFLRPPRGQSWASREAPVGFLHLPLALMTLPGVLAALLTQSGWMELGKDLQPGAPGIPGLWFLAGSLLLLAAGGLVRAYVERPGAGHLVSFFGLFGISLAGASLLGFSGLGLGLGLAAWGLAELAVQATEGSPGGPEEARLGLPLPAGVLLAGACFAFLIVVPELLGWHLLALPLAGPALAAGLFLIAAFRLNQAAPFAAHLHLGPLLLGFITLSLSRFLPLARRLDLLAATAAVLALLGVTPGWRAFREQEAVRGGGPASRGWKPLADVPLFLVLVASLGNLPLLLATLAGSGWDLIFGLVSATPGGGDRGVVVLLALGLVLLLARQAYTWLRGLGTLGAFLVALGVTHGLDMSLWPESLRPTSALLSAGLACCLLEAMAHQISREDLHPLVVRLQRGCMGLVLLLEVSAIWLAIHRSQFGSVYESMRLNWSGGVLSLAVFLMALSAWGRRLRGDAVGAHQFSTGLALGVGLAGAWLGGLTGAAWGFSLAALLGAELAVREGDGQLGGSPGASVRGPLPTAALVSAGFLVCTMLLPDLLLEQLSFWTIPAVLLLIPGGVRLARAIPFALHLHTGAAAAFYALWMTTRHLPPESRASVLGAAGFLATLLGFTPWWGKVLSRESAPGGGPAAWGLKPLVDIPLLSCVGVLLCGWHSMAGSGLGTLLWMLQPESGPERFFRSWLALGPQGILPLLGFGATLVAARARTSYVRFLGVGYLGGICLALGLAHGLALALEVLVPGGMLPGSARLVGLALALVGLDRLACHLPEGLQSDTPRHLGVGSVVLIGLLGVAAGRIPLEGVQGLADPLVMTLLGTFVVGGLVSLGIARRSTWGSFSWPFAFLLLMALHLGLVLQARGTGFPPPSLHDPAHGYVAQLFLSFGLGLGLACLRLGSPSMGRHLSGILILLSGVGLASFGEWVDHAGFSLLSLQGRQGLLGAVVFGVAFALLRRGKREVGTELRLALPVVFFLSSLDGSWPLAFGGALFYLAGVFANQGFLTWPTLLLEALAGAALVMGLLLEGVAIWSAGAGLWALSGAAGLGLAATCLGFSRLVKRRQSAGDRVGRGLSFWPAQLMERQLAVLAGLVELYLAAVSLPLVVEQLSLLRPVYRVDPRNAALFALLWALAGSLLILARTGFRQGFFLGLAWILALQSSLLWLLQGVPVHGMHALVAATSLLACLGLGRLARKGKDKGGGWAGVDQASLWGVTLVLWRLLGARHFPAPDLWAALAAAVPAFSGAYLLWEAVRREREILVYAAEVAVAGSFLYLRGTGILQGSVYGQLGLQLVAFVLLGVAERARKQTWSVVHTPFRRSAMLLPALVLVRCLFPLDWRGFDGWGQLSLGAMASALYGLIGVREDRAALRYLAGACFYLGLSLLLLRRFELDRFWEHVDFYIVPLGLLVMLFSVLERGNLLEEQQRRLRTVGLLLIYISPAFHAVWGATAAATMALILLGVLGIVTGQVAGIPLFTLYGMVAVGTGATSYVLNIYRMARWNFAFLTFSSLAVIFGVYSARMRKRRRDIGLS
jgi:hypothetical protein